MDINTARFKFIAEALHGAGGFRPADNAAGQSHLIKYPREGEAKWRVRNEIAWYATDLKSACTRFAGYLAQKTPMRDLLGNPLYQTIIEDADWRSNNIDMFWLMFTVEAKARGSMLLLVDMPRDVGASIADQIQNRAVPYFTMIAPESIESIGINAQGKVERLTIYAGKTLRGWDAESWWIEEDGEIIEQVEHGLSVCPVLAFGENQFPQEGEFSQIADISKRLFNLNSELDEILRSQTFGVLTYQVPPDQIGGFELDHVAAAISTQNMLIHSGNTPSFISPDKGSAEIYTARIAQLEEKIRRIGHMIEAPNQAESGIALQLRFQQLNSSLSHWASKMQDLERNAWDLVARWLGLTEAPSVQWETDYSITDLAYELDTLQSMIAAGFSEQTLIAKRQEIVRIAFNSADADTISPLVEAEEQPIHERIYPETMTDASSNPDLSPDAK